MFLVSIIFFSDNEAQIYCAVDLFILFLDHSIDAGVCHKESEVKYIFTSFSFNQRFSSTLWMLSIGRFLVCILIILA
jgi:hypothetical protein